MKARWLLPVVLIVMIITAGAAVVARAVYTRPVPAAAGVVPDKSAVAPGEEPGDPTVHGTNDAATHPLYETARQLIQTNFDAINSRNYDLWRSVVSVKRAKQTEVEWRRAYRSTRDGTILIQRIESGTNDTAKVLLTFTSVQDPKDAPQELPEPCIRWQLVLPLSVEDDQWKLDSGPEGQAPQHQKC
jgi:hypothetical protein